MAKLPERLQADALIEIERIKDEERVKFDRAVELFQQRDGNRRRPHSISGPPRNEKGELTFDPNNSGGGTSMEPPRYIGQGLSNDSNSYGGFSSGEAVSEKFGIKLPGQGRKPRHTSHYRVRRQP